MSHCAECVEKAKLRNRDMKSMLAQAKKQAIEEKQPFAVCWATERGLYTAGAAAAIIAGSTLRHIVSGLQ